MATYTAPASFEQLVQDYDHFIEVTIYRMSRGRTRPDDMPDLKQAVYLRLLETGYLERYHPDKGSVSNYLFYLIRSVLANVCDKNSRNPLNLAYGLDTGPTRYGESRRFQSGHTEPARLKLEVHPAGQDHVAAPQIEFAAELARLREVAGAQKNGARLCRVLELMLEGHSMKAIATEIGKSGTTLMVDRRRLQQLTAVAKAS